ncbi:MAG: hypothetical protein AB7E29_02290 [Xanthobacter sp.]
MWWFLVLLGLLIAVAGLAVVAIGISIFVTTFGNALVTTGAVAASGGFIIIAMGLVLRQLERLNQRLEDLVSKRQLELSADTDKDGRQFTPTASRPVPEPDAPSVDSPARIANEYKPQDHQSQEAEEESSAAPAASSSRLPSYLRSRNADQGETKTSATPEIELATPMTAEEDVTDYSAEAPEPQLRPSRSAEPPPVRLSTNATETEAEPRILKSGIVGGMAYTLYSDGSIQADLPDGVVRFSSLHELRDHVAKAQNR